MLGWRGPWAIARPVSWAARPHGDRFRGGGSQHQIAPSRAEYVGEEDQFDQSVTDLAERYTEQIERDYRAFTEAVRSGRLEALEGA
jgi:Uncharacterized protein conserved in bacteria (DUF2252)